MTPRLWDACVAPRDLQAPLMGTPVAVGARITIRHGRVFG